MNILIMLFWIISSTCTSTTGAEEYDVNNLPDTPENKRMKEIARIFELKYLKSSQSDHNNEGLTYFEQDKRN